MTLVQPRRCRRQTLGHASRRPHSFLEHLGKFICLAEPRGYKEPLFRRVGYRSEKRILISRFFASFLIKIGLSTSAINHGQIKSVREIFWSKKKTIYRSCRRGKSVLL